MPIWTGITASSCIIIKHEANLASHKLMLQEEGYQNFSVLLCVMCKNKNGNDMSSSYQWFWQGLIFVLHLLLIRAILFMLEQDFCVLCMLFISICSWLSLVVIANAINCLQTLVVSTLDPRSLAHCNKERILYTSLFTKMVAHK